jgi:hypothetical protein
MQTEKWKLVGVRVLRTYLQVVLGLLGGSAIGAGVASAYLAAIGQWFLVERAFAAVVSGDMPRAPVFFTILIIALSRAVGPAVICAIWNTAELLGELDKSRPGLRG